MRLEFFPSPTLTRYLAKLFVVRILAVLVMLVLVLQTLDLLSESGKILGVPGNGQAELWHYISLRTPQLIARFLPYSVLLATIITLATLNQNSEVVAMKAAGLSAHQVLAPLLLTAAVVSAFSFAFNERVVTRATSTLKAWTAAEFGAVPPDPRIRTNVYLPDGPNILAAAAVSGTGKLTRMDNVTWYRRDAGGMVLEQLRAPHATYANPGWQLDRPIRFEVASTQNAPLGPTVVARGITPEQVAISKVDPDGQNVIELYRSIQSLKAQGRRTSELEGKWWHKFSGPLAALLMPLLGAVAAFGLARSGQLLIRAIIGMALGFAYFVVDNAALAMGNFGGYPPLIAAWAPFLLFALVGETVLVRTEE
ncbi:LPS export ABC transporter permease LptG [Novosphingobium sp.]|jgi:lipopolysaccharide export system permease protein|uniref:LPS export ABC transporter permease LptG n=1 Tax=Novosphingobium sp. TaxID=1874826 RepID=UPI0022C5D374|nr:LPS export ABC transporter permease LptG [Novosphingobium sp.]MCZ8018175.1 LPS export ABC transporter permease LptG [Novosphingobium sp.]MCZ8033169.1 LPS export ABC transporter permease LptG [Novosphingobium sp.]MCZ8051624.1 LPS export ABC transporter permease LptG [Novosphingobium sp.]MCZ8060166.1 LPS export ABC transporter permease LptG [Novosphingobium sp.]MCZ8231808.1 LPS export ABC transporter permease LptG [Novosphingobium sp.]